MLIEADRYRKIQKEADTIVSAILSALQLYKVGVPKDVIIESFNLSPEQVVEFNNLIDKDNL